MCGGGGSGIVKIVGGLRRVGRGRGFLCLEKEEADIYFPKDRRLPWLLLIQFHLHLG